MVTSSIQRLQHLCQTIPQLLLSIPESEFKQRPAPGKWSKQEIIGHLLDSATNNHQRFIRVQFEEVPYIRYEQDQWVKHSHYNELDRHELVELWKRYNLHLAFIASRIDAPGLSRFCNTGGENPVTLEFLIDDYVVHMEHHLREVVEY